ncbi:MAG: type pullulanase [Bacteroidota bacterium]
MILTMFSTGVYSQRETDKIGDLSFDNYPVYQGQDLGLTYSKKKSDFKIWSPPAAAVRMLVYETGEGGKPMLTKDLEKGKNGTWSARLKGDWEGKFYTFQMQLGETWLPETADPYARTTGVNGKRAMILDLKKTNPEGWESDSRPPLKSVHDIILYELHLRDISVHPAAGIERAGKYLGLTETGTKTPDGRSTGLDHLKELGVTHVHILPAFDFKSLDERDSTASEYNWGYDPQNYNVPEGSYATNPYDGSVRIREFKQMVKALHQNGLRVVMDVVYNHVGGDVESSPLYLLAPNYYFRFQGPPLYKWSNGSACGNETASERAMVRKFILESMVYWAKEYHIDGFRVDLMGLHDIETMNQLAAALRAVDPTIFIYGEGWTAGESTLYEQDRAIKSNASRLDGVAVFCDEFRDAVKGHVFKPQAKGFVSGGDKLEESVKFGIVGAVQHPQLNYQLVNYSQRPWAKSPAQCINYVSCHDNHTLWDRLKNCSPESSEQEWLSMDKLAQTLVFTSQGIPFLHAGEEFVRTKFGEENSYKSLDVVNQMNWEHKSKYSDLYEYYRNLILMRKAHPAFRMQSAEQISKHLEFLDLPFDNTVGYLLKDNANGDSWKRILLLFNGNKVGKQVSIPEGNWNIICQNGRIDMKGMGKITGNKANLHAHSALILAEW